MSDYNRHISEHLRITLLRILDRAPEYRANDSVLADAAYASGLGVARDRVRTELAWLAEQGLVTIESFETLQVATITQRGQDVAAGRATVPGVKRPSARG